MSLATKTVLAGNKFWWPLDVTDWFPKEITPVHEGLYRTQVEIFDGQKVEYGYSIWKNGRWGPQVPRRDDPAVEDFSQTFSNKRWKGLAFDPFAKHVLPDTLHAQVLRDLAKELELSEQALSKLSLAHYQYVHAQLKKGHTMAMVDKDGNLVREMSMLAPA